MRSINFNLLIYDEFIQSFDVLPLNDVQRVVALLDTHRSYLTVTAHRFSYALLDDFTDQYFHFKSRSSRE